MIATGLVSMRPYMKSKTVDLSSGIIFFLGSAPGTILGAYINKGIDLPYLTYTLVYYLLF